MAIWIGGFAVTAVLLALLLLFVVRPIVTRCKVVRRESIAVPLLGGKQCDFCLEGYSNDSRKHEFDDAIANFLKLEPSALQVAESYLFRYYKDCEEDWRSHDRDFQPIDSPSGVWNCVSFSGEVTVSRRRREDKGVYLSLEGNCDWEEEHGLQLVFRDGNRLAKVGPCDGHVTNADSYDDDSLEGVIYVS